MSDSTKRILYTRADGRLCIISPADECSLTIDEIKAKDVPSGLTSYVVNKEAIPKDRSFRNAWTYTP